MACIVPALLAACSNERSPAPSTPRPGIAPTVINASNEHPSIEIDLPAASLPDDAVIIERSEIPSHLRHGRALLLWMSRAEKHQRDSSRPYDCPDRTRGSYFRGPTRVSLLDTERDSIINTVRVIDGIQGNDMFSIPYSIRSGHYYYVPGATGETEGRPVILYLYDYNSDGLPLEFAFFEADECNRLQTTLLGYSQKDDRLIWYPVKLSIKSGDSVTTGTWYWVDHLFSKTPLAPGHWKYTIDRREQGGTLDIYEVTYDQKQTRFSGWLTSTTGR